MYFFAVHFYQKNDTLQKNNLGFKSHLLQNNMWLL